MNQGNPIPLSGFSAVPTLASFAPVGGSYVGSAHHRVGRNNQDAFALRDVAGLRIAVVCDGCSEGPSSEIGAGLGARWLASRLPALWQMHGGDPASVAFAAGLGLADYLRRIVEELGPDRVATLAHLGLFTFLSAVISYERFFVFGLGDGVVFLNGEPLVLEADADGAPDYIAYKLVPAERLARPAPVSARVLVEGRTSSLRSLHVASDGAQALLQLDPDHRPGLRELLIDERLAKNPSLLTKRLRQLATSTRLFHDDTTVAGFVRHQEAVRS